MFIYTSPSFAGATLTVAYQNDGGAAAVEDSYTDFAIAYSPEMVEGLTLGYAAADQHCWWYKKRKDKTLLCMLNMQ